MPLLRGMMRRAVADFCSPLGSSGKNQEGTADSGKELEEMETSCKENRKTKYSANRACDREKLYDDGNLKDLIVIKLSFCLNFLYDFSYILSIITYALLKG